MVGACRAATSLAAFSGATNSNNLRSARWTRAGSSQRDERYHAKHVLRQCPRSAAGRKSTRTLFPGFCRLMRVPRQAEYVNYHPADDDADDDGYDNEDLNPFISALRKPRAARRKYIRIIRMVQLTQLYSTGNHRGPVHRLLVSGGWHAGL